MELNKEGCLHEYNRILNLKRGDLYKTFRDVSWIEIEGSRNKPSFFYNLAAIWPVVEKVE